MLGHLFSTDADILFTRENPSQNKLKSLPLVHVSGKESIIKVFVGDKQYSLSNPAYNLSLQPITLAQSPKII